MYRMMIAVPAGLTLGWGCSLSDAGPHRRARAAFGPATGAETTRRAVVIRTASGTVHLAKNSSAPQFVVRDAASGLHSWKPPV